MKKNYTNIFDAMQNDIMKSTLNEREKSHMLTNLMNLRDQKINIMITGATGSGKSSTINALFDMEVAKVGVGVDPETMDIEKFELDNLTLWDTPGLGDGKEADERHIKQIVKKLTELDDDGNYLIDLVLVILDGSSRDMGTSFDLINNVIIPNLGEDKENRILVAINQADMAMKGRNWDYENNRPNQVLVEFLEDKVRSVRERIFEATGIEIDPIYYCAGYKEDGETQSRPYNISKLLYYIVNATPSKKRLVYVNNINKDEEAFMDDDGKMDYVEETKKSFFKSVIEGASYGAEGGKAIGEAIFGETGGKIGACIGAIGGAICGAISFFGGLF